MTRSVRICYTNNILCVVTAVAGWSLMLLYTEPHLGGGVMSPFMFQLAAIVVVPASTVISNIALRKDPQTV